MEYSTTASSLMLFLSSLSFVVLLVVLFCTKNSSSEREAAAVHLVFASVDAKSQKRWRIVAGTNEVEEVLLFDVDFVFFFVVVPDEPPIIITILFLQRAHNNNTNKSVFRVSGINIESQSSFFRSSFVHEKVSPYASSVHLGNQV